MDIEAWEEYIEIFSLDYHWSMPWFEFEGE